jgi:hypothetical protein
MELAVASCIEVELALSVRKSGIRSFGFYQTRSCRCKAGGTAVFIDRPSITNSIVKLSDLSYEEKTK